MPGTSHFALLILVILIGLGEGTIFFILLQMDIRILRPREMK